MTQVVAQLPDVSEDEYLSIAAACKSLLTAPDAGPARIAIPWLHVIREHPVFLVNYAGVARQPAGVRARGRLAIRRMRERAGLAWQLGAAAIGAGRPWAGPQHPDQSIDVLFLSHLLNPGQAGQAHDFYFGALPEQLTAAGYRSVVALTNQTRQPADALAARWPAGPVPRVVLSGSLGFAKEMSLQQRMHTEARRLRAIAATTSEALSQRVALRAAVEAGTSSARRTLRMDDQIAALVAAFKPRMLIVTHEGHAWERIAFAAARRARPAVVCIGYQHAAIFRRQFAIRQALAPAYNPDRILTAGPMGRDQLKESSDLREMDISVLGSDRAGHAARDLKPAHSVAPGLGDCLVIPEGLIGECNLLFEFSAACARAFPETRFVWRLHPGVTFALLRSKNRKLRDLPPNVRLSSSPLDVDLGTCGWALYRGTTAVVQAVNAGLRPIYLRLRNELTIDPLYGAGPWRASVETAPDLHRLVSCGRAWPDEASYDAARRYCAQFFVPFDAGVIAGALSRERPAQPGRAAV